MREEQQSGKRYRLVREIIETLLLTAIMFFVINMAIQNYDVDGPSMEPSLHNQERIMVDKVSYLFHGPARGDVVVFVAPPQPDLNYVKRIIGVPGDVVAVDGTTVKVNGVILNETYVHYQGNPYLQHPIERTVIPPGKYFVMGDDRINSYDSRAWGLLPRSNIIGRAALVYWPLGQGNSGFLPDVSSVFSKVPQNAGRVSTIKENSTFGMIDSAFCVIPGVFLVCSRYRRKKKR